MWSGVAISLSFLAFRIFVRIKSFGKIYSDDVLALVAWLMFLASAIIWQSQQTALYGQYSNFSGTGVPTPEQLAAESTFLHAEAVIDFMYFTSLWIVKLSFLFLFRRLGQNVRGQKIWWWCVAGFTVATWAACIGGISWNCLLRSLDYTFGKEVSSPHRSWDTEKL